jgi:hypothetical protein
LPASQVCLDGLIPQFMTAAISPVSAPLKLQLAHGWAPDWSSLRAWVVWVRV